MLWRVVASVGVILIALGVAVFVWYGFIRLDSAEIARLEAGGAGTGGGLYPVVVAPLLWLFGGLLLALAWWKLRRRASAPSPIETSDGHDAP